MYVCVCVWEVLFEEFPFLSFILSLISAFTFDLAFVFWVFALISTKVEVSGRESPALE